MERIQQLPTSMFNAIAKGIDQSMGNKNKEAETIVDGLKIISGSRFKFSEEMNNIEIISNIKTLFDIYFFAPKVVDSYNSKTEDDIQ